MSKEKKKIVLASASVRRSELLAQIGLEFDVCVSKGPEVTTRFMPDEIVRELSYEKAKEVYNRGNKDAIVIGADTLVWYGEEAMGKPKNVKQCKEMLKLLSGETHEVYTGVTIMWNQYNTTHMLTFYERTRVKVAHISDSEIDEYIATGDPMDKAGGYGIQGYFARFIEGIEGDYNNVVGLPVGRLYQEMKKLELV